MHIVYGYYVYGSKTMNPQSFGIITQKLIPAPSGFNIIGC